MQFINIRLLANDFSTSFQFWRDVMRLPVKYGPGTPGIPAAYAYFQMGEIGIELMPRETFAAALGETVEDSASADRQTVLVFKVDDVDIEHADLLARGATAVTAPHDYPEIGVRTAHVADPDSHLIEIYCPLSTPDAPSA